MGNSVKVVSISFFLFLNCDSVKCGVTSRLGGEGLVYFSYPVFGCVGFTAFVYRHWHGCMNFAFFLHLKRQYVVGPRLKRNRLKHDKYFILGVRSVWNITFALVGLSRCVCFLLSKTCDGVKYDELSVFTRGLPSVLVLFCCNGPLTLEYFAEICPALLRQTPKFNLYPQLGSASFHLKDKFHIRLWNPHTWITCPNGNLCFLTSGFEHLKANYPTCIPTWLHERKIKAFWENAPGGLREIPPPAPQITKAF